MKSHLETLLLQHIQYAGLPLPLREYRFHPGRQWRFDFYWPEEKLAVEVEGGIWQNGRHSRGSGYSADCEKYNRAVLDGYRVLRFTGMMVESGEALRTLEEALGRRE